MSDTFTPPPPSAEALAAWAAAEAEAERELAEADAAAAAEAAAAAAKGSSAPAAPSAPVHGRRPPLFARVLGTAGRFAGAALFLVCVGGGVAGGIAYTNKMKHAAAEAAAAEAEEHAAAHPEGAHAHTKGGPGHGPADTSLATRIDTLIRSASFPEALELVRSAPRNTFGPDAGPLAYREALCLEGLGKWKDANAAFKKAEADTNVAASARALLGRARCAIATDAPQEARAIADRVLLRSGHPECRGSKVYEDALHLRAQIAVREIGGGRAIDALNADALAWPAMHVTADKCLEWLPTEAAPVSPVPDAGRDLVEFRRNAEAQGAPEVTVRLSVRPAIQVVRAVAKAAGLTVRAENDVVTALTATVGPVEVERLPLGEVLSAVTERAGVVWDIRGETLVLTRGTRATDADATADALRRIVALAPEHPAIGATRVTLANVDLRAGRFRAATLGYKQVLENAGTTPEVTHAAYNLGLLELKDGNRIGARARFLEVIDRAPGTYWADTGWYWIGRTHLDGDAPELARRAYLTALDGGTKDTTSAAALSIIVCDLLAGNDEGATERLRDTRFSTRESHANVVAFFEALVQYRIAPTESRRERLLAAIRSADEARGLGPAGAYFMGRVYLELGMAQQMSDLYDATIETARGPIALRMLFDTAERFDRLNDRKLARSRYLAIAAADPEGLGALAELRLAAMAAREGQGADAVRRCQAIVNRPGVPRAELLTVMGRGYELQRKHGLAAECFAGRVPSE
ncbi:hypothetical protein J8F10_16290 [Gemmata sp. G18]|uniref:Tetratricopeptide repeat protein n=1 Tax=Gemmata palustris TaxID=2822762 RepID=A0ABS5BSY7_9BACT|nr:hypothetical protein [Gemmata palustris]MBP3956834.1 hypothetical protein [Gemmata palustris]